MTKQQLGKRIKTFAKDKGITNAEISRNTSLSAEQVGWIMNGKKNYTIDSLLEVCNFIEFKL